MRILGISAFHRDAAAALLVDGRPVAAAQEERFSRKPLDPAFPRRAARYCLQAGGIRSNELDRVVFYEKPLRKFERVLAVQMQAFPRSARSFAHGVFQWLGDRLWIKNRIVKELGVDLGSIVFTEHQLSLAANAFYTSPFEEAALLTVDDAGEWATCAIGRGRGGEVTLSSEVQFPHSLGLVASAITQHLGFVPGHEEHRLEDLATLGKPKYADALRELVRDEEGYFSIDQNAFRFAFDSERMCADALEERLGPARYSGERLCIEGDDTRHADIAASLQQVLVERVLALAAKAREFGSDDDLCFAGELASNRHVTTRLVADGPFRRVFVPDAPSKAGGALGAALYVHHALAADAGGAGAAGSAVDSARTHAPLPAFGEAIDDRAEDGARELATGESPEDEILRRVLAGEFVAWVRGRMEFGLHSLGNRSIFANPLADGSRQGLLAAVQRTEGFLSCRLVVPADRTEEFFEIPPGVDPLLARGKLYANARENLRSKMPSSLRPDGTAWPQTVQREDDPTLHALLTRFGEETGTPILLHADFAPRGAPLVRTEADAVDAFRRSSLHCLVVGSRVYVPS